MKNDESSNKWAINPALNTQAQLQQLRSAAADVDWENFIAITDEDVQYLLDRCPFLQIINTAATEDDDFTPSIIRADSGWLIHTYSNAMSSSPGHLLYRDGFSGAHADDDQVGGDEGGGAARSAPAGGTIIKQAFDTAAQMVALAIEKYGWQAIRIVDGHPLMKWAAWVSTAGTGVDIFGYKPGDKEQEKYKRLARSDSEIEKLLQATRKQMG